jgi:hypothetical protein
VKNYRINKALALLLLFFSSTGSLGSQRHPNPSVEVDGEVRSKETFVVRIVAGGEPITFCQRLNVTVRTPKGLESAPRVVEVEKFDPHKKKWFTYTANLPDIGLAFSPASLKPQESHESKVQVESPADYRLKLTYLEGDLKPNCPELGKRQKRAVSQVIHVRQ